MIIQFLATGILIGFLASVPVGPISILIIQRTINRSRWSGFYSGVGAAMSDTIYATIAGFSMALIIGFIRENEVWFRVFGSMVLLSLGVLVFFSHPEKYATDNTRNKNGYLKDLIGTFLITVTNPLILFMHLAIFSGFGIALSVEKPWMALFILLGFFAGAKLWWFTLSGIISRFRSRFNMNICLWFNRIAGTAIVVFVLVSLAVWLFAAGT